MRHALDDVVDDSRPGVSTVPGGQHAAARTQPRGPRRTRLVALAVAALILLLAALAYGLRDAPSAPGVAVPSDQRWVAADGTDGGPGTAAKPWRTIGYAVGAAPSGSLIYVRDGTYQPFAVRRAGLRISSAPGERATIRGRAGVRDAVLIAADHVTVSDVTVAGCVPKPNPNFYVTGDHGSGVRIERSTGVTIRNVIVRDSNGLNAAGLQVGCYGILATDARDALIASSEVYHNGAGIVVTGGGRGVVVENNNVHDQNVILQNSKQAFDDFGGYGLAATFVKDKPGPIFRGNTVVHNVGPSTDYGVDGGGVEIYDAANTTISGNRFSDNDGVVETGTGSQGACADNVFAGNTVTGRSRVTGQAARVTGLVLRCGADMAIRDNTFTNLDSFTFLLAADGQFAGSVEGMRITGNTVTRQRDAVVFRLQFASGATPQITVDNNRYHSPPDHFGVIADGADTVLTFDAWKSRTGFDAHSSRQ